eukprot:gene17057-biopygen2101
MCSQSSNKFAVLEQVRSPRTSSQSPNKFAVLEQVRSPRTSSKSSNKFEVLEQVRSPRTIQMFLPHVLWSSRDMRVASSFPIPEPTGGVEQTLRFGNSRSLGRGIVWRSISSGNATSFPAMNTGPPPPLNETVRHSGPKVGTEGGGRYTLLDAQHKKKTNTKKRREEEAEESEETGRERVCWVRAQAANVCAGYVSRLGTCVLGTCAVQSQEVGRTLAGRWQYGGRTLAVRWQALV